MRGKRAKQIRKAAGGQELARERKYGYVPVEQDQKNRVYDIEPVEIDKMDGTTAISNDLRINPKTGNRNYKLCPLRCLGEGRGRVKALKRHFNEQRRAS